MSPLYHSDIVYNLHTYLSLIILVYIVKTAKDDYYDLLQKQMMQLPYNDLVAKLHNFFTKDQNY